MNACYQTVGEALCVAFFLFLPRRRGVIQPTAQVRNIIIAAQYIFQMNIKSQLY
jgi:hypothetical protein